MPEGVEPGRGALWSLTVNGHGRRPTLKGLWDRPHRPSTVSCIQCGADEPGAAWAGGAADLEHLPPEQLVDSILEKEARIAALLGEIKEALAQVQA